ncbi:MAG: hypothetical protein N2Z21_09340 [Candidatus Sumerlaeaceae bacterium]|nr:hypothetical protein [Candidatus Sumerlaeaceae bacterium]
MTNALAITYSDAARREIPMKLAGCSRWTNVVRFLVLLGLLILATACKDQDLVFKPDFSINLFYPGPKWPNVKKLGKVEQDVYQRYGKPQAFRVLWPPNGDIRQRSDLEEAFAKQPKVIPPYSWVYPQQGIEIVFRGQGYEEQPLSDKVRLVLKYGDPEDVKELSSGIVQWTYYSVGKMIKLRAGRVVEVKEFPPMGRFIKN